MSTLTDTARTAAFASGEIIVRMESGREIRFPVADNPRLARGTPAQLSHIEISPFGLHWPDLDEDISVRGLLEGNHGQRTKRDASCVVREEPPKPNP
jgi:Protein of unknown function (DUF2442)